MGVVVRGVYCVWVLVCVQCCVCVVCVVVGSLVVKPAGVSVSCLAA